MIAVIGVGGGGVQHESVKGRGGGVEIYAAFTQAYSTLSADTADKSCVG